MKAKASLRGEHSTYIELAALAANILARFPEVTGISPGFIQPGKTRSSARRIKIGDKHGGVLLTVRHGSRVQEITVYTKDGHRTKLELARKLRDEGIPIGFKRD